jgi:hypothetical protein
LIFTTGIHYFHHFELFCITKFLSQIYKITLKTSGQYGNMNKLRIKRCMQLKYLPLFHHFKAIYQFPKHILIVLVKIVANASNQK